MAQQNKNFSALIENHESDSMKPVVVLEGSARSGKTYSALMFLVTLLHQQKLTASVFRADSATHDRGALRDFQEIMINMYLPIWKAGKFNKSLKTFTFANGSLLEFLGTNDAAKLHGGARDIAFFNEVIECNYEAYRQVVARTRKLIIVDFNPSLSKHWIFERIMKRSDVLYVHSTYKDNPHLDPKIIHEIEATEDTQENRINGTADPYFWSVYGLGQRAKREGAVYKDYYVCEADEWPAPHLCQRYGYGLDFGFSADPCALIECCLHQSRIYVRQIIYETGLITCRSHASPNKRSIQGLLEENNVNKASKIVADSARPEQIAELNAEGYCVTSVKKYPGSIVEGISLVCHFPIYVHRQSLDIQTELDQYAWRRKPDGTVLDVPEDRFNHALDGIRYWTQEELPRMVVERAGSRSRVVNKLKRFL